MVMPVSRRGMLASAAGAAVGVLLPSTARAENRAGESVGFRLTAEVLDGGEQVTSITLETARLGPLDGASLTTGTFSVHAKATSPIPLGPGDAISGVYDVDRQVTAARLDERGDIVLDLRHGEGQNGCGTLGYLTTASRNLRLNLVYTITQRTPIARPQGGTVTISSFVQGQLSSPEVDAFSYHVSGSGLKYRLYSPPAAVRQAGPGVPLVVWLHGAGEGALLSRNYYDNETTLRANRGALGFATPQAQQFFSGAYVVAPQSTSYWMEDGPRFAPLIREIIGDLVRDHPVDPRRIYVAGCSNGGYMTMKMTTTYPGLFAASVPICGVVTALRPGGLRLITDAELRNIAVPTWLVASRDDTTVPPAANTVHAHDLIPGAQMTLYDHVIWNGYQFSGHFSWVYVARNDPRSNGISIWQWLARQHR